MTDDIAAIPSRLGPFLAQWDHVVGVLNDRLEGMTDDEYLWQPDGEPAPVRTLAWTVGHLGAGSMTRADYLTGSHSLQDDDLEWPMTARAAGRGAGARQGAGALARRRGRPEMGNRAQPAGRTRRTIG